MEPHERKAFNEILKLLLEIVPQYLEDRVFKIIHDLAKGDKNVPR